MVRTEIHLRKRFSRAGRMTLVGVGAALLSLIMLLGTLHAALGIPSEERLSSLARAGALDYSAGPGGLFESLRASFIAKILGLDPRAPTVAHESSSDDPILATPIVPTLVAPLPGRLPRTIVEHPFDNDDFDDAYPISTIPFTGKTDTRAADREGGEPETCEPVGGTVWYRYRPTRDIGLVANSFGSDHPVAIGVFQGRTLDELTLLECDVHSGGNAQVLFPAKRQRNYYFRVTAPVSGGKLAFSLDPLGSTSLVSVSHDAEQSSNGESKFPSVSANGRFVSFMSAGDNLMARKPPPCFWRNTGNQTCIEVYVRDMAAQKTELVSRNSRGVPGDGFSGASALSGDGRYVAFFSTSTNLVQGDTNRSGDIFLHDRKTNKTERVSVSSTGKEGTSPWSHSPFCEVYEPRVGTVDEDGYQEFCANNWSEFQGVALTISSDGRYVAFTSTLHGIVKPEPPHCSDLTAHDGTAQFNHGRGILLSEVTYAPCRQVYIHDRKTDETRLISVSSDGEAGYGDSAAPFISRNGRWVVFSSSASNLVDDEDGDGVDDDTNEYRDVFVHDLKTRETELVSLSTWGEQGNEQSGGISQRGHMSISDNGRWVTFVSHASNLTQDDGNANQADSLFVRDRRSGETILVTSASEDSTVAQADVMGGVHAVISADGRYITFTEQLGDDIHTSDTSRDHPLQTDIFVYDRVTRTISLISVATSGEEADAALSQEPEISADGHFVVFHSQATNLDRRDRDPDFDVFIHELPWTR